MRCIIVLLTIVLLSAATHGHAQQINFTGRDVPLEKIFAEIRKQVGYVFLYEKAHLKDAKPVTITAKQMPLEEFMKKIFIGQPLEYVVNGKSVYVSMKDVKQLNEDMDNIVKGIVVGEGDMPLAGATVRVKGTDKATTTDASGIFGIRNVAEGSVLEVSYVGYEQYVYKIGKDVKDMVVKMKVSVKEEERVEVIVNTGYQKLPKERATGSFVFVDSAIINRSVDPNIINRLEGIAPGILFDRRGGDVKLQIRGLYTLTSELSQPLIVVNNFPYSGDLNTINPNDVENISILRDAAAASIWGSKAGNGVIVITTKNGKFNRPLSISSNASITFGNKPALFDLPILSTSDQIDIEKFAFEKGLFNASLNNPLAPVPEVALILSRLKKKEISEQDANRQIDVLRNRDVRHDYLKYLFRKSVRQQYAMSLSGGSNINTYYFSLGFDKSIKPLITDEDQRISMNLSNILKLSSKLQVETRVAYTFSTTKVGLSSLQYGGLKIGTRILSQYASLADENGNALPVDIEYRGSWLDTLGQGQLLDWKFRPLDEAKFVDNGTTTKNLLTGIDLKYNNIIPGVSAGIAYQYEIGNGLEKSFNNLKTYYTRNQINMLTNPSAADLKERYPVPMGGIMDLVYNNMQAHSVRGQVNYNAQLNNIHSINIIAGGEIRKVINERNAYRKYGYNENNLGEVAVDYANPYPLYYFGSMQYITNFNGNEFKDDRSVAWFTNLAYSYNNRYTLSVSARKDATNFFGVNTNQKGRPFYSAGLAWKISSEEFYKSDFLPGLNLRITYGNSGTALTTLSPKTLISYRGESPVTGLINAEIGTPENNKLKWEKVSTFNLALDFSTYNNRVSGNVEVYFKSSKDVFSFKPMDLTIGTNGMMINSANMKGSGLDVQLTIKNIEHRYFRWNSIINISHANYKVTKSFSNISNTKGFISSGYNILPVVGMNPYSIISYAWAGLDPRTGDPMGYIKGNISKDYAAISQTPFKEQVVHGSNLPLYFGNFSQLFSWKSFSLSTNITFKFKYYFLRTQTLKYTSMFVLGGSANHVDYLKRWQKPGDEKITDVPSMIWPPSAQRDNFYSTAAVNVLEGDHIRWNDMTLSYSITRQQWRNSPFHKIQLSGLMSGLNVLIWSKNKLGMDPENQAMKSSVSYSFGMRLEW